MSVWDAGVGERGSGGLEGESVLVGGGGGLPAKGGGGGVEGSLLVVVS